jgi:hypothetical protein
MSIDTSQFTGSTRWFRHMLLRNFLYTEGVQYVAEQAGAYWLIDLIASYQTDPKIKAEDFQVWRLRKKPDDSASVTMTDGNTEKPIVEQQIELTDFPDDYMEMWVEGNVLLLPSEH